MQRLPSTVLWSVSSPAAFARRARLPRRSLVLLLLGVVACAKPAPVPTAPSAPAPAGDASAAPEAATPAAPETPAGVAAGALRTDGFGGARWGFVEASSDNGRLVVLRRFLGDQKPTFGHHGETSPEPELTVYDRFTGKDRLVEELIDIDPSRRWLLILADGQAWLVDASSGDWEPLDAADMSGDGNRCLPPRQASFSAKGARVAWVIGDGAELVVRDLATRDEWTVKPKGRLWRGWPDDDGRGAIVAEVPAGSTGWPAQRTSCACRWCNRFAASYGFYGWGGPAFTIEHAAADGTRTQATPPEGGGNWHGKTASGCEIKPASEDGGLERGPWRWVCP